MKLTIDVVITIALLLFFCVSHSYLAANKVKKAFQKKFGKKIAFYRLGYNILSAIVLILIYLMLPTINLTLYDLPYPFDLIVLFFQLLSIAGLLWCIKYFSGSEFLGWSQIKRYINEIYNENDLDEKLELRVEGPYKYSRHPVYLFSIIFLVLRPVMGVTYFIIVVIFTAYFYVGSLLEEKRLVEKFGDTYIQYQKSVPRFFSTKVFGP